MSRKSLTAPKAFFDFAQRFFFQDFEHFETIEDLLRFGLRGISREELGDFITFVKRLENREISDVDLEHLWNSTDADVSSAASGLRLLLRKARELAEREGPDGSLYVKEAKWSSVPRQKSLR